MQWPRSRQCASLCPRPPPSPPSSHHPSPLITMRINLDAHFVYFHNVVNCPYSTENIFPHFRVLVTQFIAIYSTKADSNSTSERRKKKSTKLSPSLRAGNQNGNAWKRLLPVLGLVGDVCAELNAFLVNLSVSYLFTQTGMHGDGGRRHGQTAHAVTFIIPH